MQTITAYLHTLDTPNDAWLLTAELQFQSADSSWMLQGLVPNETDIVPWQEVVLPTDEILRVGVVFSDPLACLSVYVRTHSQAILELQTKGYPCIRFISPGGSHVSIQIHEQD